MIIQLSKKRKLFLKCLPKYRFFSVVFIGFAFTVFSQNSKLKPKIIGFLYNKTTEENFLFNDTDYSYDASVIKLQGFYHFIKKTNFQLNLVVQPQIHLIQHQLLNEFFVTPAETDYIIKREKFTKKKNISLFGLEFGLSAQQKIVKNLFVELTAGLGFAYIDTGTERLAKGFTFIENGSLGFLYKTNRNYQFYSGIQIGHVSNFDFNHPNSGYNNLGFEIGIRYQLQ